MKGGIPKNAEILGRTEKEREKVWKINDSFEKEQL